MSNANARRTTAGVLLVGAVLGIIGNALHPLVTPDMTVEEFLETADTSAVWAVDHVLLVASLTLLAVGVVLLSRWLRATRGAALATMAATFAVMGGTIAIMQIGALDLFLMSRLADAYASGENTETVLAIASASLWLDYGLLALWVGLLLGATFLALGLALQRAKVFAGWIRWTAIVAGAAGTALGIVMLFDVALVFAFYALRVIGLVDTIVAIAIGVQLYRGKVTLPEEEAAIAA
jgi:hypothetical protein